MSDKYMEKSNRSILDKIACPEEWQAFLQYKLEKQNISKNEEQEIRTFIEQELYLKYAEIIAQDGFPQQLPHKKLVNKEGSKKKRVVYTFDAEENIVLKFIAFHLYAFEDIWSKNCYSFRRNYGVKEAMAHFRHHPFYAKKYCFKADISNYFNSMDVELLLQKMEFLKQRDAGLYELLAKILREEHVVENGKIIKDAHGGMAGMPVSPFFANLYLTELDRWFEQQGIPYFRYSDDMLLFADTKEELDSYREYLITYIQSQGLKLNPDKVYMTEPGQSWEFLGFSYSEGAIDLSENTLRKMKAKIKRKAEALRRWQREKGLTEDKAAIGFINAMNRKFYGIEEDDIFTWNRWFFPILTEDDGLKKLDVHMQEYIRYIITGRHYKGNYRITYEQLKKWGYRSLVNAYYRQKKGDKHDKESIGEGNY